MTERRISRIEADHGPIEILFPSKLSEADVQDFKCHVDILLRFMRRLAEEEVSKEAMNWATEQIASGVLSSPMAQNADGSPKTLRQLLDESRPDGEEVTEKEG